MKQIYLATISEQSGEMESSNTIPIEADSYEQAVKIAKDITKAWRTDGKPDDDHGGYTDGEIWWWLDGVITDTPTDYVYTSAHTGYEARVTYERIKEMK